jgi:hypothetical protein
MGGAKHMPPPPWTAGKIKFEKEDILNTNRKIKIVLKMICYYGYSKVAIKIIRKGFKLKL